MPFPNEISEKYKVPSDYPIIIALTKLDAETLPMLKFRKTAYAAIEKKREIEPQLYEALDLFISNPEKAQERIELLKARYPELF